MIGIINYGLGNLKSIQSIVSHVGGSSRVINSPDDIEGIKKFILPGVGAFDHGMRGLNDGKWIPALNKLVLEEKIPILGICLGMQLMCSSSDEGNLPGLGWINADVRKFEFPKEFGLKIPHMGWNTINLLKTSSLFSENEMEQRYYFVHSYHVVCGNASDVLATANYGFDIHAAFVKDNIIGMQFHPEKSHRFGKMFFKNFIAL
jgi:imidazole glycerol-phosphate synthase subunit HisH